MKGADSTSIYY